MHLGNYSFALYIVHWPVIALMRPNLQPFSITDRLAILVTIGVISLLFYFIVDRGWERVRRSTLKQLQLKKK